MSWETRNGRRYFYHSVRDGDKVHKVYVGTGDAGRAAELAIEMRREREQQVRDWLHQAAQSFDELDVIDAELALGLSAVLFTRFGLHMDVRAARRIARKQGDSVMTGNVCDPPLTTDEQETWRLLRERASRGDREAADQLLPFLDRYPLLQKQLGDVSRHALNSWLDLVAGRDEVARRAAHAQVLKLIASLQQNATDPLERLLTQRVGLLWLQTHYIDLQLALAMSRTPKEKELLDKRQRTTQQTYATAVQTLRTYQQASGTDASRTNARPSGRRQSQRSSMQ